MARSRKKRREESEAGMGVPKTATAMLRLDLLLTYKWSWLWRDLTAGLLIFAVTVPPALAYGQLAGLAPINGLYACLLAMGLYSLFGTSRQLVIGAEATVAIMVVVSVSSIYSGDNPARFATLVFLQALMVGVMLLMAGVFRVGYLSDFIPKSVVTGFINGMALIIILSQAGKLAGVKLESTAFFPRLWELITRAHEAHHLTLYVGGACLLLMLILRPLLRWVPEVVVVMVLATLVVMHWNLGAQGIDLVGSVPAGLPKPMIPIVKFNDILIMLPMAVGVALVGFVENTITGRAFAMRGGYRLDPNQELIALGLANLGTGFFQGFAIGSSHARSTVNEIYGGRSQFAGFLAALFLAGFLFLFTGILKNVPSVVLPAIIIVAGIRLLRPGEVISAFKTRPASCYISLVTTLAVLIAGLMTGIIVSVVLAIVLVLHHLARPHETVIRMPKLPGLLIYRFAGPLFFLNAAYFASRVQELIDSSPRPVTFLLINAEAIVDMDDNGAEVLEELQFKLKNQGITLGMSEVKGHFRKVLMSTRLPSRVGFVIYPSVSMAFREMTKEQSVKEKAEKDKQSESPEESVAQS